ncbi:sensor histidine kinase [Candidatus Marinarcus aquaticus]|uniref:histidine kinase n=1 Tax=Candidatus Marinarcus aquaticus TaxID=2044504 RepID=A0A4Q0XR98_9BACT|nr:HAMP domain-containing sensor histidine kinase [Candidatus Marinarcus aquaticus]RXJ59987.1 hypothetical protein CRV04_02935 [Candidatus Marinarcus aquaticus]
MLENSRHFILRITLIYSAIFFIFIALPSYFYGQLEIENHITAQQRVLFEHAQKIQRAIYDFSTSKSDTFVVPKSFKYEVMLLDKQDNVIYETSHLENIKQPVSIEFNLAHNRLGASKLIISKNISYQEIYLKIFLLVICVGLFIVISSFLLIQASIEPYKKVNEYLDAFFNDAMHELKTPLGVIQMNLEMLHEKQPHTKELQRSMNATKNLFLVYEDIEYLIKQKSVNYNKEWVDFSYLLSQRLDQFESLTHSKELTLEAHIQKDVQVQINRMHLQRIIDNTVSNAIKYSYKKTTIEINLIQEDQRTLFAVHNIGEVIQDTKRIFNRYYKENSIKGGFGIGLNIVKNICEENNILIDVDSSEELGTSFQYNFLK